MEYHIKLPNKDYDLILTEYKEIPLTQGKVALNEAAKKYHGEFARLNHIL